MRCLGTTLVAGMGHPAPAGVKGITASIPGVGWVTDVDSSLWRPLQ